MEYIKVLVLSVIAGSAFLTVNKRSNITNNKKPFCILIFIMFFAVNIIMILYCGYLFRFVILYNLIMLMLGFLSLWDIREKEIPAVAIYILAVFCMVMMLINPYCNIINNVVTGILFSGIIGLAYKLTKEKIGLGDVEVLCAMAFAFGYPNLFNMLFISMISSVIFGIMLIVLKKATIKTEIPFLPFIFIGYILNITSF